ncbi:C69 family dipeptidase [Limosilactobacillus reuteri]|uniref:Dipeptidase n=1 Tax=Limosilactobacillus reuteri subsp. rodentium (strain DSM 17509 / CIP 109821 / 100-23) TaxID=349123 RepID=B3XL12_LIMR1|nr:C69 family dipeptidase [Limosilactobacillus reuteri]EDX42219.1 peptidase U34 dipeptidase [Limosilactobacillus reuteri subsp. rodentium]MCC4476075.1 C69 family dipeptidase [Limosilactobacillus reuteri]
MGNKLTACTSILIGKDASIDGTIMIGRNEDAKAAWPKHMVVHQRGEMPNHFISKDTRLELDLPEESARYTATPEWTDKDGLFEEDGINEYDVAMSATESAYSNALVLGYDPLVENGLNEEAMITVVLPYVKTAREGVQRLGNLIAKYGTGETNGVLFADNDEAWYFETGAGHYWVAQRIPDDSYAVVANQLAIQEIDFNDSANFMFHPGIQEFVEKHDLNPDPSTFNFRKIFGTADRSDAIYSEPRVWAGHQMFSPRQATDETPESTELPFIMKPDHKLSIFDAQNYLSNHYEGTEFDPLGHGEYAHKYRPISLAKTQESHILQMNRPGANIHWLAMGVAAESTYVPFFNGITDTPATYKRGKLPAQLNSAYWIFKHASVLVDSHLHDFLPLLRDVQKERNAAAIKMIAETDRRLPNLKGEARATFLTRQSDDYATDTLNAYKKLSLELITKMTDYCELNFNTDENL